MEADQRKSADDGAQLAKKSKAWLFWLIPLTLWPTAALILTLGLIYGPMVQESEPASGPEPFGIGDAVALGGYSLKIDAVEFLPPPAAVTDALLVVVKYTLTNTVGSTLDTFEAPEIVLKDSHEFIYNEDLARTAIYANQHSGLYALNNAPPAPGGVVKRAAVFQVSEIDFDPARWIIEIVGHDDVSMAAVKKPESWPTVSPASAPACTETYPIIKHDFDTNRAYPQRAYRNGIEGRMTVEYSVSPEGELGTFKVLAVDPPGYFEDPVEQEFRRMKWYPAIDVHCAPARSEPKTQSVVFRLG